MRWDPAVWNNGEERKAAAGENGELQWNYRIDL